MCLVEEFNFSLDFSLPFRDDFNVHSQRINYQVLEVMYQDRSLIGMHQSYRVRRLNGKDEKMTCMFSQIELLQAAGRETLRLQ